MELSGVSILLHLVIQAGGHSLSLAFSAIPKTNLSVSGEVTFVLESSIFGANLFIYKSCSSEHRRSQLQRDYVLPDSPPVFPAASLAEKHFHFLFLGSLYLYSVNWAEAPQFLFLCTVLFPSQLYYIHPPFFSAVSLPRKGQPETMLFRSFRSDVLSPQFLRVHFASSTANRKAMVKNGVNDLRSTRLCSAGLVVKFMKDMHRSLNIIWWAN